MSAAKRDPRRTELDKYLDAYRKLALPEGNAFEQAVWCVLTRNGSREHASKALSVLWTRYVDVNELRVAQVHEVARLIAPHIKNDADRVAAMTRAFLRAIVRGQHQMSFDFVEEMTLSELRGYLGELGDRAADVALAMLIHFCRTEIEAELPAVAEVTEEDGSVRPRKKGERDLGPVVDRLRLLFSVAGYGHTEGKGQPGTLVRRVSKLLDYAALPPRPVQEPQRTPSVPALDDDEEGPDDADLANAEKDTDVDEDLDVIGGDFEEDADFEEFDDDEEGAAAGKGGGKGKTGRSRKTSRRATGRPKSAGETATRKGAGTKRKTTPKAAGKTPATKRARGKGAGAKTPAGHPAAKPAAKKAARKAAKSASKKAGTPKSPPRKTGKAAGAAAKGANPRGGGATRPRTARKPARKSPTARKSSRRR